MTRRLVALAALALTASLPAAAAPAADPAVARDVRTGRRRRRCAAWSSNFAAEFEASTRARIVGEAPGGSPHNSGDSVPVELPALGWTVHVPPEYVQVLGRRDTRASLRPDLTVVATAADHFAGRDPVLARALR